MRKFFFLLAAIVSLNMMATEGALPGAFTINKNGDKIQFSKGNLQATYDGTHWNWAFAASQYDYIGDAGGNNVDLGSATEVFNETLDLFGWSTTSTNYGINISTDYKTYFGSFNDWGNNPITNGGNQAKLWRTLTREEWDCLFRTRPNAATLFALGGVNGVNGLILLPDNWTTPAGAAFTASTTLGLAYQYLYYYDENNSHFSDNTYNTEQWKAMESAGAVFLPCAGARVGKKVYDVGTYGYYWSATTGTRDSYYSYNTTFDEHGLDPMNQYYVGTGERFAGLSVRLVQPYEEPEAIDSPSLQGRSGEATKTIKDGHLLIELNGKTYNAIGAEVK